MSLLRRNRDERQQNEPQQKQREEKLLDALEHIADERSWHRHVVLGGKEVQPPSWIGSQHHSAQQYASEILQSVQ